MTDGSTAGSGAAFGRRAARAAPRALANTADCPCGGGRYGDCCGPILAGHPAGSAEALMRSRYTAFSLGDAGHLAATWHPSTRPADLAVDPGTRWTSLEIVDVQGGGPGERRGTVEFRAQWREGAAVGVLAERSRFVFRQERWWYLDGDVDAGPQTTGTGGRPA